MDYNTAVHTDRHGTLPSKAWWAMVRACGWQRASEQAYKQRLVLCTCAQLRLQREETRYAKAARKAFEIFSRSI